MSGATNGDGGPDLLLCPESELPADDADLARALVLHAMPGYLLRRLDSRASGLFETRTDGSALTPRQFGLLQVVHLSGSVRQSELAAQLHLDRSTLGEMLHRMSQRGLVTREAVAEDRRTTEVTLTDRGRQALLDHVRPAVLAQRALLEPLPAYLQPVFLHCLRVLADAGEEPDLDALTDRLRRSTT